ncbi:uncharacterized protein Dana_GF21678, isoform B [Drosophila ananassae]|uniref:Uncharacterized protein, isoform B n=1 Tax=Drosophila ananassae TaxID=7217 RepID=A0A0P8XIS3_DROAN|nr:uncharacterized protein Dana_GF21678, isoform B [Drosophila ananassae]
MCTLPTTSRSPRKTASCDGPTPLPTPVHLLSGTSLVSTLGEQFSPNAANNDLISQSVLSRTTTNAESAPANNDLEIINSNRRHYDSKAARAKILGSAEIHVKRESTIALTCSVNTHASSVMWYHGSSIVDFDSLRGGISLETEKTDMGTTSRLMLTRASFRDSGNYTCVPNGAIPASVRVHVLTGEQPAAMQTSGARRSRGDTATIIFISIKILYISRLYIDVNPKGR